MILGLPCGSGRDHCDLALAVEVPWGKLWSWACCFRGDHCDLGLASDHEVAVEVRPRKRRRRRRRQRRRTRRA